MEDKKLKLKGVSNITVTVSDAETSRKFLAAINRKNIKSLFNDDCEIHILFNPLIVTSE